MKKETAKTQAAREWLHQNPYIEVLDALENSGKELVYKEFSTVFWNDSDPKFFMPGHYSPLSWAIDAVFVYGYLMGKADSERESKA